MADMEEIRRQNLRRLVAESGSSMNSVAKKLGLTKGAYISQLLTDPPFRTLSEKTARKWEKQLGLAEGWLDSQPRVRSAVAPVAPAPTIDAVLLERVMSVVFEALKKAGVALAPARLAELVTIQYSDALALGRVDPERVRKIVGLIKR